MIRVPRVNTPVWKTLEPHLRRNDVKIINIQKPCTAVGFSLAYTLDMVCKNQNKDLDTSQLIRHVADGAAMLGHINADLSLLRSLSLTMIDQYLCGQAWQHHQQHVV